MPPSPSNAAGRRRVEDHATRAKKGYVAFFCRVVGVMTFSHSLHILGSLKKIASLNPDANDRGLPRNMFVEVHPGTQTSLHA
jgi:hypothetical protein